MNKNLVGRLAECGASFNLAFLFASIPIALLMLANDLT
jgi:hypothetical protein